MNRAAATPAVPLADPAFVDLKALIVAETGHHYYEDKDDQLAERIAKRMAAAGIATPSLYLERLRDRATGPREWRQLESELTIKETFFFRFAEQFTALRRDILPGLIAARAETRRLRIWSAGCSTGAEPYSLAVILRDLLGEAIDQWHVSILGTDIDEGALAAAREGRYGGWSLRTVAPDERERLFVAEGSRWRLRPLYRGMVRFERLNILDLLGPAAPLQLSDYDLILCRNMLIYFRPDVATGLVRALGERIVADGWLLLGHAEAGLAVGSGVEGVELGGIIIYRQEGTGPDAAVLPEVLPATDRLRPLPRRPVVIPRRRSAIPRPSTPAAAPAPAGDLDEVRRLLDAGSIAAARAILTALKADGRDGAVLHYLDGVAAAAEGDAPRAEKALRGALYLDGGFAMAHYLLGQQLAARGRPQDARRALANAARAVAGADSQAPVTEGDGRTVGDLREAVRARLAAIGPA